MPGTHCSFIRLADYLIVNTMHVLGVNSVSTLLHYLSEQLQNTPSLEEIQSWNREIIEEIERAMEAMKDKQEAEEKQEVEEEQEEEEEVCALC